MVLKHSAMLVVIASVLCLFLSIGVPTVDAQGLSVSINEGDAINSVIGLNTTLTCSTTGATSVAWFAPNGFQINPTTSATKYSINFNSVTGNSTLTIISIITNDAGSYTCRATSSSGQTLSDSIELSTVTAALYEPLVQSDTLDAIEGETFTLLCIASSQYVEAEVYWSLDGQRLNTSCTVSINFGTQYTKSCRYSLTNVQRSDNSKVFYCLANLPGILGTEKQKKWTLSVKVRPSNPLITQTSTTVQAGSTASWSCTTSGGNPTPTMIWQLDLTQVSNGGSYIIPAPTVTEQTVNGYTTYTVTSTISWTLGSQDIGKLLYCKVTSAPSPSNAVASLVINTSTTVTLTVQILGGDSFSATEGQSITLICSVVGTGSIVVTWFGPKTLSGTKYTMIPYSSNSGQSTLTISNLDFTDSGTYMCLARSSASSSDFSDSVTLTVTAPLSVDITNGISVTGVPGQSITLTCTVTGSGTITVSWLGLTGAQLFTNSKYTVVAYDTNIRQSNLTVNSLTTSDAGTYTCRGSDSSGSTRQDTVQLIVTAPLSVNITNGPIVTATQGESVMLTCTVTGSGTITVIWNGPTGVQLFTNFKYTVGAYNSNTRQSILTINSVATSDAGTYTCRGKDSSGTQESSTQLTLIVPLTVSIDNGETLSRPVSSDATITCSVSGSGTINVVWIGPLGNTLTSTTKYTVTSYNINTGKSTLTIFVLSMADSGSYICRATNGFGSTAQDSITLTAYAPLTVSIDNGDTLSRSVGSDVTITCSVSGSGTISVVWIGPMANTLTSTTKYTVTSYNISTGKSTLTIFVLTTADSGLYICRATDGFGSTAQDSITLTAYVPLSVSIDNGNSVTGVNGGSITITCSVSGTGAITVTWVDPLGNIISSGPKYTMTSYSYSTQRASLTIQSLNMNDVGNYTCRASDSSSIQLEDSIYLATAILTAVINEETLFATVGENKIINCTVTGSYQSINWYLGNTLLSNGLKYQISQSTSGGSTLSTLTVYNVQYSDAARYVCQAVSSIDGTTVASDSVALSVGATPVVTIGLTILTGFSGQDIRVNCTVTGTEPVTVTWYVNNTALTNAASSPGSRFSWQNSIIPSLTISKAVESDTGIYRCQAQNSYGTGSDTVQLTVEANPALCDGASSAFMHGNGNAPSITVASICYRANVSTTVTLDCTYSSGLGPLQRVRWFFNGELIIFSNNFHYVNGDASKPDLTISSVTPSDEGTYQCELTNAAGSTNSSFITLDVLLETPPTISVSQQSYQVDEGKPVTLNVIVSSAASVSWTRNGNFITPGQNGYNFFTANSPNLIISNASISHAGTYIFTASNTGGSSSSHPITLSVTERPTVSAPTTSITGYAGNSITVQATVTGSNITSVIWSVNGTSLTNDGVNGRFSWTNRNSTGPVDLIIRNLALSDTGTYVCTVRNTAGANELIIRLTVSAVPVVTVSPKPVTGYAGQSVTINCTITQVVSISSITIAWYRNSIAISKGGTYTWSDTTTPSLQILNLDANQHQGTYRCTATSSAGMGYDETNLSVIDRPTVSAPTTFITGNEGSNITVQATVTGSPITSIIWSFNGTNLTNDGVNGRFSWTNRNTSGSVDLIIRNLSLSDAGSYICTVRNAAGANELMIRLTVSVYQPIITIPQNQYYAEQGGNMTLQCNVQGSLISGVTWTHNNAQIQNGGHYSWTIGNFPHLRIINIARNDMGNYVCSATNSAGGNATAPTPINLDVQYGPVVTIESIATLILVGQHVTLMCRVTANPKESSVVWTKVGSANQLPSTSTGNSTNYVFTSISLTDAGTYRCQATNTLTVTGVTGSQLRENSTEVMLFVQSAPTTVTIAQGTSVSVPVGQTLSLLCNSDGSNPRYFWTFKGQNVSTSSNYTLNIDNRLQAGDYSCTAYNEYGSKRSNPITVDVLYAPVGINGQDVTVEASLNVSVTLTCNVNANPPNCSYTWYDGDRQTILKGPSTDNTYLVGMNSLSDFKVYRCQANNTVGTGQVRFTVIQAIGPVQTGASTGDKPSLSQAAIAGIVLGVIFFVLLVIIVIICCCTYGTCRKDDAKTKVGPSEKKTDILHQPIVAEPKRTSEQGSDPFLANGFQSKPQGARMRPLSSRQLNGGKAPSYEHEDSARTPARKPPHHLEPISPHKEERQGPQHKTSRPRQEIPKYMAKSSVVDQPYRSLASTVSRQHVDITEKEPDYGFEEEPRYTDLPYQKSIDYTGPIISLLSGDTAQAFQIPATGSTAMYDYEEPLTQKSSPPVQDTTYLYEDEDRKKKKRRKKKRHHHHRRHVDTENFGDEEPYPEGPPGTNPYLEIKDDYDDIEVVPGRSSDPYNRHSEV